MVKFKSGTVVYDRALGPYLAGLRGDYKPNIFTVDHEVSAKSTLCRKIVPGRLATPSNPKNEHTVMNENLTKLMGRKLLRW